MYEGKIIVHQSVEDLKTERKSEKIAESVISILKEMKS
jgi:Cu-processing system ATP-binding protein